MTLVRRLTGADARLWQALRLEALVRHPEAFLTTLADARRHKIEDVAAQLDAGHTFGAFEGLALLGNATLAAKEGAEGHRGMIFAVYVAPNARGQGVGAKVIKAAAEAARQMGIIQLELYVESGNQAAIRLYQSLGFQSTGRIPRSMLVNGRYYDEDYMIWPLDA